MPGAGASEDIIQENDELYFYDALPTVWDETKVLECKIGEYATIARKNEADWFIGSLTANQLRKIDLPLTFLDEKEDYEAVIFFQNAGDLKNNTVRIEKITVHQGTVLSKNLIENSGLAVIIRKL